MRIVTSWNNPTPDELKLCRDDYEANAGLFASVDFSQVTFDPNHPQRFINPTGRIPVAFSRRLDDGRVLMMIPCVDLDGRQVVAFALRPGEISDGAHRSRGLK